MCRFYSVFAWAAYGRVGRQCALGKWSDFTHVWELKRAHVSLAAKKISPMAIGRFRAYLWGRVITMVKFEIYLFYLGRENTLGEHSAKFGRFSLRSELGEFVRIALIGRHDARYGSAASAQTFGAINEAITNPIYFEEITDVDFPKPTGDTTRKRIRCFGGYRAVCSRNANRSNPTKK